MEHDKSPLTPDYRQLIEQLRGIGCTDQQIIGMLLHVLERIEQRLPDKQHAKP